MTPTLPAPQRTILKSSLVAYLRKYLNDPAGAVWNDSTLSKYVSQGEVQIGDSYNTIWIRFYLPIQSGVGTYQLPQNVKHITRITYRGFKVDVLTQKELALLSPVYRTQQSRPRWASWQFDGMTTLRLFPVPNEDLLPFVSGTNRGALFNQFRFNQLRFNQRPTTTLGDVYSDTSITDTCIISAYLFVQEDPLILSLPDYAARRTIKNYVLWKCFAQEGDGQDPDVAQYYKKKFDIALAKIIAANTKVYANKQTQLSDVAIQRPWRKHWPVLPPTFGTPVEG